MKLYTMFALVLCALLFAVGCKGRYSSKEASEDEVQMVSRAVASYVEELAKLPDDARQGAPVWLRGPLSAKVLKVEKMGETFKALVEVKSGDMATSAYFLIGRRDGEYGVTGVL